MRKFQMFMSGFFTAATLTALLFDGPTIVALVFAINAITNFTLGLLR